MDDITLLEDLVDLEMTYNEVEDIVKEKTSDYTIPRGELEFDSLNGAKLALKILEPHYEVEYRELQNNGEDHQATYKVKFMRKGVRNNYTEALGSKVNAWRVGGIPNTINSGIFFTLDKNYFEHSDTGYKVEDAKEYVLDLSGKVFDPVSSWDKDINIEGWSHINLKYDIIEKYGMDDLSDGDDDAWGIVDTEDLSRVAKQLNYDALLLRDVPSEEGYGPAFTEVVVYNKNIIHTLAREGVNKKESYMKVRKLTESVSKMPITFVHDKRYDGEYGPEYVYSYDKNNNFVLTLKDWNYSGYNYKEKDLSEDPKAIKDALPYAKNYLARVQEMVAKMEQMAGE